MSASAATTAAGKGIPGCASPVSDTLDFCMEWNADNQLIRVTLNGNEVARFAYDPEGRRVEKVAGAVTATYLYDGAAILREVRGSVTLKHVHGPGIDAPLAREDGSGALTYYHQDALGSIVKHTSQAGTVIHEYRYDAWGNIEAGTGYPGFAFTGREWDPDIGLHYYRARYYDPRVGRFIGEDPLGFDGGKNFYRYVGNQPSAARDPFGLLMTKGCGPTEKEALEAAAMKAERRIRTGKGCICAEDKERWIQKIRDTTYHCDPYDGVHFTDPTGKVGVVGFACAVATDPSYVKTFNDITFFRPAFLPAFSSPSRCGCLEGLLIHEIGHLVTGIDHDDPNGSYITELAVGCFSCAPQ